MDADPPRTNPRNAGGCSPGWLHFGQAKGPAAAAQAEQPRWEPGQHPGQLLWQGSSDRQGCPGNAERCRRFNLLQNLALGGQDADSGSRSHVPSSVLYLINVGVWPL